MSREATLLLQVDLGPDADPEEIDSRTRHLRDELRELDVESVELVYEGAAPEGARAVDLLALGKIIVEVGPGTARAVARAIRSWVSRTDGGRVTLEVEGDRITVDDPTSEQQQQLVDAFVARLERRFAHE